MSASQKGIEDAQEDTMRGLMVINNGSVESSSGSLVGQDHLAQIFQRLLQSGCGEDVLTTGERFKTVTIAFPQHYYTISRRGTRIFVARLAHHSASAEMFVNSASNTVQSNRRQAESNMGAGDDGAEEPNPDPTLATTETTTTAADIEAAERIGAEEDEVSRLISTSSSSSSIATVRSGKERAAEGVGPIASAGENPDLPPTLPIATVPPTSTLLHQGDEQQK